MPNLTISNTDGYTFVNPLSSSSSLSDARNATTANGINNTLSLLYCIHSGIFNRYYVFRPILFFDFSGNDDDGTSLSGQTVTAASLQITTSPNVTGFINWTAETDKKVIICKTNGAGTTVDSGDFNALDNWPSSGSYEGTVTKYGEANQNANAVIIISLSAQAVTDINAAISGGSIFSMAMCVEDDWTYSGDLCSNSSALEGIRIYSGNSTGSKPKLMLTYGAAPAAPTDNATFFGTNF